MVINSQTLEGEMKYNFSGIQKSGLLTLYHSTQTDVKEEAIKRFLSNNNRNISIRDLGFGNADNRDSSLIISARVEIRNEISEFNNEVYVPVDPFGTREYYQIDEKRRSDIHFGEKLNRCTRIVYKLPEGLQVKHLPDNLTISNEYFECTLHCSFNGGKIYVDKKIRVPNGYVPLSMKNEWNAFQRELRNFEKSQMILVRN